MKEKKCKEISTFVSNMELNIYSRQDRIVLFLLLVFLKHFFCHNANSEDKQHVNQYFMFLCLFSARVFNVDSNELSTDRTIQVH